MRAIFRHAWHHNKPLSITVLGIGLIFAAIIGFHMVRGMMMRMFFAHFTPPPVTVSSSQALKKMWEPQIAAVGNFLATQGVDIKAEASGNVTRIYFESGQHVLQGAPLIDIDDSVEQATLKFNQAQLVLAKLNYQRQFDLNKRGASAASTLDEARAKLEQAQSDVEKTEALILQKHITAPFTGRLGIRQVNLGEYIAEGQTVVVTLQSHDPLYLEFYVPEQQMKHLYVKQPMIITVDAYPDRQFIGEIHAINAKINPDTHNVLVQATLPNCAIEALQKSPAGTSMHCDTAENIAHQIADYALVPGMFASIHVAQKDKKEVIVVPSTAISYSLYGDAVFRIETDAAQKDAEGKPVLVVRRVFVKAGPQQGNDTVIESGLSAGDRVVSVGEIKLQNGARVTIDNHIQLQQKPDMHTMSQ